MSLSPKRTKTSVSEPVGSTTEMRAGDAVGMDFEMFGPHTVDHAAPVLDRGVLGDREWRSADVDNRPLAIADDALEQVHGGRADEAGDEQICGPVEQFQRRADLFDAAVAHDHDLVGHRHGLDLVVRDIDRGGLQPLVQFLDLGAHLDPQLCIEIAERLVEQEDLRIANDRASHGHALALPAGKLPWVAFEVGVEIEDIGRTLHPFADDRRVGFAQLERKRHVLLHRLVRIERVILEHHRDVALGGRQMVDHAVADGDRAAGDGFEPCNHPQQRGFSATRRAHQNHELPVGDIDADIMQNLYGSERLGHIADSDLSHHPPDRYQQSLRIKRLIKAAAKSIGEIIWSDHFAIHVDSKPGSPILFTVSWALKFLALRRRKLRGGGLFPT